MPEQQDIYERTVNVAERNDDEEIAEFVEEEVIPRYFENSGTMEITVPEEILFGVEDLEYERFETHKAKIHEKLGVYTVRAAAYYKTSAPLLSGTFIDVVVGCDISMQVGRSGTTFNKGTVVVAKANDYR